MGVAVAYVTVAWIVQLWLGRPMHLFDSIPTFGIGLLVSSTAFFLLQLSRGRTCVRAGNALPFLFAVLLMQSAFHSLKLTLGHTVGFPLDRAWMTIDAVLHGGDPGAWLHRALSNAALRTIDGLYAFWFLIALGVTTFCAWTTHPLARRARIGWVLVWIVVGTIGAWFGASAGPAYFELVTGDPRFAPLLLRLDQTHVLARSVQIDLWSIQTQDLHVPFAGVSAMPSMHVAGAVFAALLTSAISRSLGVVFWVLTIGIQIGSVALGWHYAIDGYVGGLMAWACWWIAGLPFFQMAPPTTPHRP